MKRGSRLWSILITAFSLASYYSSGQLIKQIQPGVYTSLGYSKGRAGLSETARGQVSSLQQRFMSAGVYFNFIVRDNSPSKLDILRYVKIDIGTTLRSGIFEPVIGNVYKIEAGGFDLSMALPVAFKISNKIDAYTSAGPIATYLWYRDVTPAHDLPAIDQLKIGLGLETGIWIRKRICIGYRATTQWGSYSFWSNALYAGVNFGRK